MSRRLKKSLLYWLLLSPLVVLVLFPYAVMFFTAVKPQAEVLGNPTRWLPSELRWQNFTDMWAEADFGTALLNSLYVSATATLLALALAIPAAYAMSRFRFAGKGLYRQFLLVTQMLSPIVLVMGLFRLARIFGLVDDINGLVFGYGAFALAFAVWMLQSYFATIPKELEEAAWIDGAGRVQSLMRIFLPLAVPAMVVTAIFTFIQAWNEFVLALTLVRSGDNETLPLRVVNLFAGRYRVDWHIVMAAALVATVPVAIVFAFLQRYLVRGLALGGVK